MLNTMYKETDQPIATAPKPALEEMVLELQRFIHDTESYCNDDQELDAALEQVKQILLKHISFGKGDYHETCVGYGRGLNHDCTA